MSDELSSIFSSQSHQESRNQESSQDRMMRIKKMKNIRKEKVNKQRKQTIEEIENIPRSKLTKEQKFEIQKEKNRVAAQMSRDRQKKYVQDLEDKLQILQNQLSKQICRRCGGSLTQDSSTDQEKHEESLIHKQAIHEIEEQIQEMVSCTLEKQQFMFQKDPPLQFYRDESSVSMGSFGKFLFICMVSIAIISISASVQNVSTPVNGRLMQQIVPYNSHDHFQCQEINETLSTKFFAGMSSFDNPDGEVYPLKLRTLQNEDHVFLGEDKCKADFIENYFNEQGLSYGRNQDYEDNNEKLMNCVKPQLIMKAKENEDKGFFQGLFTLVLDDPEIFEVVPGSGGLYLSNVVPLKGLYQIQVEFVNIKKIIGQNCLN